MRCHHTRAQLDLRRNIFSPILGEHPCLSGHTLFGLYINHDDREVKFYDSYNESEVSLRARDAYICDIASISPPGSNTAGNPHSDFNMEIGIPDAPNSPEWRR